MEFYKAGKPWRKPWHFIQVNYFDINRIFMKNIDNYNSWHKKIIKKYSSGNIWRFDQCDKLFSKVAFGCKKKVIQFFKKKSFIFSCMLFVLICNLKQGLPVSNKEVLDIMEYYCSVFQTLTNQNTAIKCLCKHSQSISSCK